ncbi:hypothetical protein ACFSSC_05460 [Corynebacterium mendelii]|uniref:YbjN domain-containing protein n=1 Tax=Corynebacterium mendelii TaxID=2765362 RepID=A0A939E083_9CORY|nr:hypothetical protein [Corynebacterium mendelii]MBN9643152.1 hypothetical protein [Corynebacterium mendelii]
MQQSSPHNNATPVQDTGAPLDVSRLEAAAERMNLDPLSVNDEVSSCEIAGLPVLLDGRQAPKLVVVRMQTVGQELPLRRRTELLTFANEMNLRPYVSVSVQTVSEGLLLCVDGPIIAGRNGMTDAQFDDHFRAIYRSCRTIARRFNTEYGAGEDEQPDDAPAPASKPAPTGYDDQPGGNHRDDDSSRKKTDTTSGDDGRKKAADTTGNTSAPAAGQDATADGTTSQSESGTQEKAGAADERKKAEAEARTAAERAAAKKAEANRLAKQKAEKEAAELARRQQEARDKAAREKTRTTAAAGAAAGAAGAAAGAAGAVTGGLHTADKEKAAIAAKAAATSGQTDAGQAPGADGEEKRPADTADKTTGRDTVTTDDNEDESVLRDSHAFDVDSWGNETCEYLPVTPERVIEWLKKRGIDYQYDKNDQSLWCPMESMWYQVTANLPNSLMVAAMSKTRLGGEDEVDLALVVANQLNTTSLATIIVLDDVPMVASEASSFWPEGIADDQLFETLGRMFNQTADALDIFMDNFEDLKEMSLD